MAQLQRIVLFVRNSAKASQFYSCLGLKTLVETPSRISMSIGTEQSNIVLDLQETYSEAHLSTGYNPILHFRVKNIDDIIPTTLQLGATLDSSIERNNVATVATIRSPDGHVLSLAEYQDSESVV